MSSRRRSGAGQKASCSATTTPTVCRCLPRRPRATENIVRALGLVKIRLRDHIILAENDYFSMRESNRLPFYDFETGAMLRPYGRE